MNKSCFPCNQRSKQGRECPTTIAMRQKPVSLPSELRRLVERLISVGPRQQPLA